MVIYPSTVKQYENVREKCFFEKKVSQKTLHSCGEIGGRWQENGIKIIMMLDVKRYKAFSVHFFSSAKRNEPKKRRSREGEKDLPLLRNSPSVFAKRKRQSAIESSCQIKRLRRLPPHLRRVGYILGLMVTLSYCVTDGEIHFGQRHSVDGAEI